MHEEGAEFAGIDDLLADVEPVEAEAEPERKGWGDAELVAGGRGRSETPLVDSFRVVLRRPFDDDASGRSRPAHAASDAQEDTARWPMRIAGEQGDSNGQVLQAPAELDPYGIRADAANLDHPSLVDEPNHGVLAKQTAQLDLGRCTVTVRAARNAGAFKAAPTVSHPDTEQPVWTLVRTQRARVMR